MKPTISALIVLTFGITAMADDTIPNDAKLTATKKSLEAFAGTWEIITVQPKGSTKNAKQLIFRKDRTYAALDANGKQLWAGTFDIDPTVSPSVWDHRSIESHKTGRDALGIYELDGDTMKACCVVGVWKEKEWIGKPRPTEFKLPVADVVLELRRVDSATDAGSK